MTRISRLLLRCHVLLVNQMRCSLYQMQELINIPSPVGQDSFRVRWRTKTHNVGRTVDFSIDTSITDHSSDLLLQLRAIQLQELRQPRSVDALVINRSYSNIMLNNTSKEDLFPMRSEVSFREDRGRLEFLLMKSWVIDNFLLQEKIHSSSNKNNERVSDYFRSFQNQS